ncbi:MAG: pyridoxal-5'-phosphate-dependent protein subunit beta, partial [Sphaerochaeta sp.]|nr:pyridoxal-5'-phosphate-dependent protein subunit beta [Sphaerochaeta sp.]
MRFTYECCDCHSVYETNEVFYQCPKCAKDNDGKSFPKGNVIVKLNSEDLKALGSKEHVSMFDFFPYPVPTSEVYPVGGTPLAKPLRLGKKYGLANLSCKLDSALPSGSFKDR